jgi:hypothetical protein
MFSCKKEDNFKYILNGTVKNARSGQSISSASVDVTQQLVSGGSFSTNFVYAASGNTDGAGFYELSWTREVAAAFKLTAEKAGYFERIYELSPDNMSTGEAYSRNVLLYPIATIEMHLINTGSTNVNDVLNFRYDDTEFDCDCCNESWINLTGIDADTTFTCQLYGDQWLKYVLDLHTSEADTLLVDSVWCPAFQTTSKTVEF